MANISQVNRLLLAYTTDSRGAFLVRVADDPQTLSTTRGFNRFRGQLAYVFSREPWLGFSGLQAGARVMRCPASQHDSGNESAKGWTRDYAISESTILDPGYLDPSLPQSYWQARQGARVQQIDNVTFPSAKVITFEENVWHAWPKVFGPDTDLRELQWWGSPGPMSVAFADGSASMLMASEIKPFVLRNPWWNSTPFQTTEWGIRGRDR